MTDRAAHQSTVSPRLHGDLDGPEHWTGVVTSPRLRRAKRSATSEPARWPQTKPSDAALARNSAYRRTVALGDGLALALALAVAAAHVAVRPTVWSLAMFPVLVLLNKAAGLYDRDDLVLHKTTLDEAPALAQTAVAAVAALWLGDGFFFSDSLDKTAVLTIWVALVVGLLSVRTVGRYCVRRAMPAERCLVIGTTEARAAIEQKLAATPCVKAAVVGQIELVTGGVGCADFRRLQAMVQSRRVDRAIIVPGLADADEMLDAIRLMTLLGLRVSVVPRLFEVVGSSVAFDSVGGMTLLGLPRYGLTKSSWYLKRAVDVIASTMLLVCLAPVTAVVALAIKATSSGPVLFRQTRIGRCGREFQMLKFRTMHNGADEFKHLLVGLNEADGFFKIERDPRVTPVGRFLRRTSLDELPQFVNVIRGDMSIVGPRPLVPEEDSRLTGWDRRRHEATPGMTGVWQVLGSSRIPLREMAKIDYLYRANWSLWIDLKIMVRTVAHMVSRRGM